jgi:hypothetical protein
MDTDSFPPGLYHVGVNIDAGSCEIVGSHNALASYNVYASLDKFIKQEKLCWQYMYHGGSLHCLLVDGWVVEFTGIEVIVRQRKETDYK